MPKAQSRQSKALELKPQLQLHRAHCLRAGDRTESCVTRRETRRVDIAIGEVLRIADRLIRRAVQLQLVLPRVEHDGVERVEQVRANLRATIAAERNVPRNREVERVVRAPG